MGRIEINYKIHTLEQSRSGGPRSKDFLVLALKPTDNRKVPNRA